MLLSELIGVQVVTTTGDDLGRVHDVLVVQDGPLNARGQAGLRLHALAVGKRSFGAQLGYAQDMVTGPWLLRVLFRKPPALVPWPAIVRRDNERIVVDAERLTPTNESTPPGP
jgi:hypothetical protein